ncbi:MAG: tetratricopeptide repeat protein [Thiobacillus sp.]|nr:tetratricopeptide repeat protein [Thiobacillus sp.]
MLLSAEHIAAAQRAFALYQQGRFQQALELAETLLTLSPPQPSLLNLAAVCARPLGLTDKAEAYLRSAIEIDPGHANAHGNLGLVLQDAGRLGEAEPAFQRALELSPDDMAGMINLGNLYRATQRPAQAEAAFRKALAKAPENINALYNLGLLLSESGRADEAEAAFRQSLKIRPNQADVYNDLGNVLMDRLRLDEAEQAYRKAIALCPDYADAYCNLGMLLLDEGKTDAAMVAFRRALEIEPGHPDALNSVANQLSLHGHFEQAELAYRKVLATRTDSANLYNNYGNLLRESHRFAEAEAAYRAAVSLQPDYGHALGQAVSCARSRYDWSKADADADAILQALHAGVTGIPALMVLSLPELGPAQLRLASELTAKTSLKPYLDMAPLVETNLHSSRDRLRIGYLSADFHEHAVMHLLAGVLEAHDKNRFEIYAYSVGPDQRDAYRERIERTCEHFHDLRPLGKIDAAKRIAKDRIDILVDLSGHTGNAKPAITALRPASIIVSWLGYPGTLGLPRLADYIIGDAVLTPLEFAPYYSETLAWMPHCYQPNDPKLVVGAKPTRRELGLPEEGVVFCSFNQAYKLTPAIFTIWCRLLDSVPGSVLWLLRPAEDSAIDNLLREASDRGIGPERLAFGPKLPMPEHLARLQLADLALDTFPYGSGATGSNVLRAGVPMVTLMGESYVSRMAASQLHAVGLPELVTTCPEDYFSLARDLACDPEKLAMVRGKLAGSLLTAPLFDTAGFTLDLERLYQRIWLDHERGVRVPITEW